MLSLKEIQLGFLPRVELGPREELLFRRRQLERSLADVLRREFGLAPSDPCVLR